MARKPDRPASPHRQIKTVPDESFILGYLEGLAERVGIRIRTERIPEDEIPVTGGLCRIEGERVLIFNVKTTPRERIRILAQALGRIDLADVYVLPAIREIIEKESSEFRVQS